MAGCMVMLLMSKLLATGEKPLCLAPYCKSAAYQQQVVRMKKHPFQPDQRTIVLYWVSAVAKEKRMKLFQP